MKEIVSASFFLLSLVQIVSAGPGVAAEYTPGKRVCVENHFYCGKCYQCTHGWSGYLWGAHLSHDIFLLSYKWLCMFNCVVASTLLYTYHVMFTLMSHDCHMIVTWHSSLSQTKDTFARRWTSMVTAMGHRMEVREVSYCVYWMDEFCG